MGGRTMQSHKIQYARELYQRAVRVSGQASYARRQASDEAVALFLKARKVMEDCEAISNPEALELLSRIEEALLGYDEAISWLVRFGEHKGGLSQKEKKRLAQLREARQEWTDLGLLPPQLAEPGHYLRKHGVRPHSTTFEYTCRWHRKSNLNEMAVIEALKRRGAFSDYQVMENVVSG